MNNKRFCVYTVLIGKYEKINEQMVANQSNIDFICFTDDKELSSNTWKIVYVDPIFPFDNVRSSRLIKICPHRFLPEYDGSVYIDNSVMLKVTPEKIVDDFFDKDYDYICFKHSFRETVIDEFREILELGYDDQNVVIEQLNTYSLICPQIFNQKPYWNGFLIRRHHEKVIHEAMEDWFAQVVRYSRRDQLSINYIFHKYPLNMKELDLDICESDYHQWPTSQRFGKSTFEFDLLKLLENNQKIAFCEKKIDELENRIQAQKSELIRMYESSNSWKITKPLRFFSSLINKKLSQF